MAHLCDVEGCGQPAVAFGQGFDGREASMRCRAHPWTLEERRKIIENSAISQAAWNRLSADEQAYILAAPGEDRSQLLRAFLLKRDA